jgi:hypothetical protein
MAGLFGLFGGKKKKDQAQSRNEKDSFFLNPDEAKSMGDIDYMRLSKKIRRTFPKTPGNQVTEIVKEVSSLKVSSQSNQSKGVNTESTWVQPQTENRSQPESESKPTRRVNDTSMDLFRQMAKDIKK